MPRKSPKDTLTIRRLKVGGRARMPATIDRFVGEGERRSIVFDVPGSSTGRLTIRASLLPEAASLDAGAAYPLGVSITRLEGDRAVVTVDGFPLARHELPAGALEEE